MVYLEVFISTRDPGPGKIYLLAISTEGAGNAHPKLSKVDNLIHSETPNHFSDHL